MYRLCVSWMSICNQFLLSKERGHGVVGPLALHSVGLHLLLGGLPGFIEDIVRPLPLINLHELLHLKKAGLLCIQCLQGEGKHECHGSTSVLFWSKVVENPKTPLNMNCYIKNLDYLKELGSQPFYQAAANHYLTHMIIFIDPQPFHSFSILKNFYLRWLGQGKGRTVTEVDLT